MDHQIISAIVERQVHRTPGIGSWPALERAAGVSRATLYRLRAGDPTVKIGTLRAVETGLGLPYDALVTAGAHDLDGLTEIGVDAELISWIGKQLAKTGQTGSERRTAI